MDTKGRHHIEVVWRWLLIISHQYRPAWFRAIHTRMSSVLHQPRDGFEDGKGDHAPDSKKEAGVHLG